MESVRDVRLHVAVLMYNSAAISAFVSPREAPRKTSSSRVLRVRSSKGTTALARSRTSGCCCRDGRAERTLWRCKSPVWPHGAVHVFPLLFDRTITYSICETTATEPAVSTGPRSEKRRRNALANRLSGRRKSCSSSRVGPPRRSGRSRSIPASLRSQSKRSTRPRPDFSSHHRLRHADSSNPCQDQAARMANVTCTCFSRRAHPVVSSLALNALHGRRPSSASSASLIPAPQPLRRQLGRLTGFATEHIRSRRNGHRCDRDGRRLRSRPSASGLRSRTIHAPTHRTLLSAAGLIGPVG